MAILSALWPAWPTSKAPSSAPAKSSAAPSSNRPPTSSPEEQKTARDNLVTLAALLEPFGSSIIPSRARTDPSIPQKEPAAMSLFKAWQYLPFFATQGVALTKQLIKHNLLGPPKPSWGIELTLFTAFLRESAAYSHLSSLAGLRSVIDLSAFLPTPRDGIVTPISFQIPRRGLRGFLAKADAMEDGKRILTGEWVINLRLWRQMQTDFASSQTMGRDRVILYLHGGAYYLMSAETHRFLTISVSRFCASRVLAINYRLAPETRFPGQLHDAVAAYMRLIIDMRIPPENILFVGDSAGGGLALATMMYLRDNGYPLPSGAILMSPWVDLTMSCESWTTNAPFDYLPQPKPDDHLHPVKCLLGAEGIHKYLTHPYVSPLFGDFTGLPPLLIQAGDAEVLRDEITLLAHKASLAGVVVEHEIFEDCVHVFQTFLFLEASRKAFQSQRNFVRNRIPSIRPPTLVNHAGINAEISHNAHRVDRRGNQYPRSLPASPDLETWDLPPVEDDSEYDTDEDSIAALSSSPPLPGGDPNFEEEAATGYSWTTTTTSTNVSPPVVSSSSPTSSISTSFSTTTTITTATTSSNPSTPPSSGATTPRAVFRDLLMTPSASQESAPSTPGSSPKKTRTTRALTATLPLTTLPSAIGGVLGGDKGEVGGPLFAQELGTRLLHARSSSHPDLRGLLEEYEARGPASPTTVFRKAS